MEQYLIQVVAFQVVFLLFYDLFLKNETFFGWNRFYLLVTSALSVLLPLVKINGFKNLVPKEYVIALPEIVLGQPIQSIVSQNEMTVTNNPLFQWNWEIIYYIGMFVALSVFLFKTYKLVKLAQNKPVERDQDLKLIRFENNKEAFSFFNYIFIGKSLSEAESNYIIQHEKAHIKQGHTWDLLYFELLRIMLWFNPLVYIYQKKMSTLHEYTADAEVTKTQNKKDYYQSLLSQTFNTTKISFINPFFKKSLIKKRIVMLQKSKSRKVQLFKFALLIPMVLGMLAYSSCSENKTIENIQEQGTTISESIEAIKGQIQKTGTLEQSEEMGLLFLARIIKSDNMSQDMISQVQSYIEKENKTEVESHISNILEIIQARGNLTNDELSQLKKLLIFITPDGFRDSTYSDVVSQVEIPFSVIENAPEFPGCDSNASDEEKKNCFSKSITEFIVKNFNTQLGKELGLTGMQKIYVLFKIGTDGKIMEVKARAPHPALEEEAVRVVKMLPEFKPGEQKGNKVVVPYSLPISFVVQ